MAGDIEDFLRRAAQRRAGRQAPQQPAPPPDIQILDAEVINEQVPQAQILSGGSVDQHVSQHIADGVFDDRLAQLGQEVDRSDDLMEAHLQEHFEHDLGQLGAKTAAAAESTLDDDSPKAPPPPIQPGDFARMLCDPASIRQAIILSEILTRPEDRW